MKTADPCFGTTLFSSSIPVSTNFSFMDDRGLLSLDTREAAKTSTVAVKNTFVFGFLQKSLPTFNSSVLALVSTSCYLLKTVCHHFEILFLVFFFCAFCLSVFDS